MIRKLAFFLIFATTLYSHDYRVFDENSPEHVKEFYRENHALQTVDFVLSKKQEYAPLKQANLSIWEVFELLSTLVDESDPDLDLPQIQHALQTAEALRKDGQPRWLILTGFLHDLGKILTLFGEPQWAVVGDTYPVGCAYSDKVVFPEYFFLNPDSLNPLYQTKYGIYSPHCGFDALHFSYGHDEYLYNVMKNHLPEEALYIIRYHSFYAAHKENAYTHFMNAHDHKMMPWLKLFSQYDLYSKINEPLPLETLAPYYQELIQEFLPEKLNW